MSTAETLWAAPPGAPLALDPEHLWWRAQRGTRAEKLDLREANAMRWCDALRPRAEHAATIARQTGWAPAEVDAILRRLEERRLLLPLSGLLPPVADDVVDGCPEPWIVIRTCARPDGLVRLLDSLLADERRFGVTRRYVIVDDAADLDPAAATRSVAARFAAATQSHVGYLGPRERDDAMAALGVGLAERDLLDPRERSVPSGARAWNWAALLAAGGSLALLDDDFAFPVRVAPGSDARWSLLNSQFAETTFFDDDAEIAAIAACADDVYAGLRRVVGCSPGALLARDGWNAASAHGVPAATLAHLRPEARVVAAFAGVYGHLAFDSAVFLNLPDPRSLANLFRAPYRHERLRADRIWHGVREPRLVGAAGFTPLLVDARSLLPPTGTHAKADDTLFLNLLREIEPDELYAALPLAIGHWADASRDRLARSLEPLPVDVNALLAYAMTAVQPPVRGGTRTDRLGAIGTLFDGLAGGNDGAIDELVLRQRDDQLTFVVRALGDAQSRHGARAPTVWNEYVGRVIAAHAAALSERRVDPALRERIRRAVSQLARGARSWPSWWERAKDGQLACSLPAP